MIKKYYKNFISGLKAKEPTSICICYALIAGILSKVADDSYKKIEQLNVGPNVTDAVWTLEECMEIGIPIFFFMAMLAHLSDRKGAR